MRKLNNSQLKIDKSTFKKRHQSLVPEKTRAMSPEPQNSYVPYKKSKLKTSNKEVSMNPKVLETWINTTLGEAEASNIPGIILKPEL
jgi:hypothetical protein